MNHLMLSPDHTTVAAFEYDIKTEHTLMYQFVYMYELDFTIIKKSMQGERETCTVFKSPVRVSFTDTHTNTGRHMHTHKHMLMHAHKHTGTHAWVSTCTHAHTF